MRHPVSTPGSGRRRRRSLPGSTVRREGGAISTATIPERPGWTPPGGAFTAGAWRDGERHGHVRDPDSDRLLSRVADSTSDEVDRALRALAAEFTAGTEWSVWQRRETFHRAAELLGERRATMAALIGSEGCKTVRDAGREVERARETLRLAALATPVLEGTGVPFGDTPRGAGRVGWSTREPLGVVAAITPFNDPLNLVAHKLGPALVAGNVIALKPHEATPLSALALTEILLDAGVPAARLAVLPGGAATGRSLVEHRLVDVVSFTGGTATGDLIARAAGPRTVLMELGGANAVIVDRDADLDDAATRVADGAFGCAGQNCLSVQRVYAVGDVYGPLLERVVDATRRLVVGSRHDPRTDVGPLIDENAAERVEGLVRDAVGRGAAVAAGGRRTGRLVAPTVLTDIALDDPVVLDEIFGPVVSVLRVPDLDTAVREVNRADTGLQAGIFTRDVTSALHTAQRLRVGAVMINDTSDFRIDAMPFGGFGRSGIGREGVASAVLAMTAPRVTAVRLTPQSA